jgi:hypothetical protein
MAKLFIGIALALMLATAALGFLAKGKVDILKSTLKETQSGLAMERTGHKKTKDDLTTITAELATATSKVEETTRQLATKTTEAEDLTKQITESKLLVDTKTREVEDLTRKLADAMTVKPAGDPGQNPVVADLTAQLQKAQAELAEAKQVSESIANRSKDTEAKLAALEQKDKNRQLGVARPGLQGRILAVNSGWNFVVLSVGDRQGVTVNAPLLVVRGSEPIARLRITSVEPSTSIADVIPGSVRKGITVQAGDNVIFEGRTTAAQPKPAGEPEPAAPPLPQ